MNLLTNMDFLLLIDYLSCLISMGYHRSVQFGIMRAIDMVMETKTKQLIARNRLALASLKHSMDITAKLLDKTRALSTAVYQTANVTHKMIKNTKGKMYE